MIEPRWLRIPAHVDEKTDTWIPEEKVLQYRQQLCQVFDRGDGTTRFVWSEWITVPTVTEDENEKDSG